MYRGIWIGAWDALPRSRRSSESSAAMKRLASGGDAAVPPDIVAEREIER